MWQQSDNVAFEQSRNVVLTTPSLGDAGRTRRTGGLACLWVRGTPHDPGPNTEAVRASGDLDWPSLIPSAASARIDLALLAALARASPLDRRDLRRVRTCDLLCPLPVSNE